MQEYDYEICSCKESPMSLRMHYPGSTSHRSTDLYMGSEDDEDSDVVALNVVGIVSMPIISKSMVSDLLSAYKADNSISKYF
jgi:hypothetical protein